jgi:hypothetical protein
MDDKRRNMRSLPVAISICERKMLEQDSRLVSYQTRDEFWRSIISFANLQLKKNEERRSIK